MFEKIIIVTKKTPLEELIDRFSTKSQAQFYIEQNEILFQTKKQLKENKQKYQSQTTNFQTQNIKSFQEYEDEHNSYKKSLEQIQNIIPKDIKFQYIERDFLPNFIFDKKALVITLGPDGLVINTAKYLQGQPILAINPDPERIDGILIPFKINDFKDSLYKILEGNFNTYNISMAKAELNDGQILYGVNDIFIGCKSHISFRYKIEFNGKEEKQCSSGIIVSTGAGSTGWFKSIINGSIGIASNFLNMDLQKMIDTKFNWDANYIYFTVREPFKSKISDTNITFGKIYENQTLTITSNMPENGFIFSDGIEKDFLSFNSGKIATISLAGEKVKLIKNF